MSYIEDLQQRVSQAEERFGLIDEQRKKYSERLINLMNTLEETLGHKQQEIDILSRDNEQLKEMLLSLLLAIEAGDPGRIGDTLLDLNTKMSALVGEAEPEEAAPEAVGEEAAESPREMVAALEDDLDQAPGEAEMGGDAGEAEDELIGAEEPTEEPAEEVAVEAALEEAMEMPAEEPAEAEEDVSLAEVEEALNEDLPLEEADEVDEVSAQDVPVESTAETEGDALLETADEALAEEAPADGAEETSAEVEAALAEAAAVVEEAAGEPAAEEAPAEPAISAEEELDASLAEVEEALAETPEKAE